MTVGIMSQLLLAILCGGVIVQTVRLMRRLRMVADGQLGEAVTALDAATREARTVLSGLRQALGGDGAAVAREVMAARELSEELRMMIGIADAMAERLSGAGSAEAPAPEMLPPPPAPKRTRKAKAPAP
ncbi:DUF6468 domain-containing protein [Sphingobium sp. DEHP117]|uniref:DUF6468 domain-containing protein n=1 Tax=Sphingobium sp. DEHP117 TaxID=2993436 RepID=UPI0027D4F1CA|nr:DUF6468 domain-containing protein [Sphingobium sp. DEHP117]MDQ4421114.1 DUF6468 domain-containing protein [Sphingobium sp. DEHP117]